VISHRIQFVIAALQVQSFRFSNLRYFISQLCKSEQKNCFDCHRSEQTHRTSLWLDVLRIPIPHPASEVHQRGTLMLGK
jgi:hypothetical protein